MDTEEVLYNCEEELFEGSGVSIAPVMLFVAQVDEERVVELERYHGIE